MNIAIIVTSYYPKMSAAAACIDKYVQHLKGKHTIHIINPISEINFLPLDDPLIKIHYVSSPMWIKRLEAEDNIRSKKNIFFNKLIIKFFRLRTFLFSSFYYPTIMSWQKEAFYKELVKIQSKRNIDVIISVVNPICSIFSALEFKKKHPRVKWITYFTDPFTFHPVVYTGVFFKKYRKKKNYILEKEVYDNADYNLFTEELYKSAIFDFNQPQTKTICFKYILDKISYNKKNVIRENPDKCTLIYAGNVYPHRRNPKIALSVLSQVQNILFDMYIPYGKCDKEISEYLSEFIRRYPLVDREQYNQMISCEYDILVNIGNNCALQIPSKMLELLSTGKPIINFYQLKDSHYDMIEKYPLGINISADDFDAVSKVTKFCEEMKGKQLAFQEVEKIFPENTLSRQLDILEHIINI